MACGRQVVYGYITYSSHVTSVILLAHWLLHLEMSVHYVHDM